MATYGSTFDREPAFGADRPPRIPGATTRSRPKLLMVLGGLTIFIGLCALIFPFAAALATNVLIGAAIVAFGLVEVVHGVKLRGAKGWGIDVAAGALALVAGGLLLFFPLSGVLTLSLLVVAFFLTQGTLRAVTALQHREFEGWGWLLASAVLEIALGILVLVGFPGSAIWLLGVLLGIDLLFTGIGTIAFASKVKKLRREA
jgi:uncharacterized membrane protein HdeD (DUF308 family)